MSSNDQFSLRWNDYVQHITKAFDTLRSDDNFVDVTLSCEGKRIHAHKMLLSACSTYFRDILKENPCQHPIIILKNVKYDDLQALVDFMYQGEVNVVQEQLTSFLTTAELLAVQGLIRSNVDDNQIRSHGVTLHKKTTTKPQQYVVESGIRSTSPSNRIKKRKYSKSNDKETAKKECTQQSEVSYGTIDMSNVKVELPECFERATSNNISVGFEETDHGETYEYEEDNSVIKDETGDGNVCNVYSPDQTDTGHDVENPSTSEGLQHDSSLQGNRFSIIKQMRYIKIPDDDTENYEITDFTTGEDKTGKKIYTCDKCNKIFRHPNSLKLHMPSHSADTVCQLCNKRLSRKYDLKIHLQKAHQIVIVQEDACASDEAEK